MPPRQEPLATWSLVLGFLPVLGAVPAIITGSRAKKAIDRSAGTKSGRGAAVAGQVLGSANLVLSVLAGVLLGLVVAYASSHSTYTSLQVGDCFDPVGHGILSALVTKKPCDKPHVAEAIGSFELTDTSWPGADGTRIEAQPQCSALARRYVSQATTRLRLLWFYPNRAGFDNGTRKVVCAVGAADGGKQTGSVGPGGGSTSSG